MERKPNDLAERVQELMVERNLTSSQFAKEVKMSSNTLAKILHGDKKINLNTLEGIAKKLELLPIVFFEYSGEGHYSPKDLGRKEFWLDYDNLTVREYIQEVLEGQRKEKGRSLYSVIKMTGISGVCNIFSEGIGILSSVVRVGAALDMDVGYLLPPESKKYHTALRHRGEGKRARIATSSASSSASTSSSPAANVNAPYVPVAARQLPTIYQGAPPKNPVYPQDLASLKGAFEMVRRYANSSHVSEEVAREIRYYVDRMHEECGVLKKALDMYENSSETAAGK